MIFVLILVAVVFGGLWYMTTPPKYPYPDNPKLGSLDLLIEKEYDITNLKMKDDYEGEVIATLLAKPLPDSLNQKKAVLFISGYADYFFNHETGEFYRDLGYNFYALDRRRQGRAWLKHQRPEYARSVKEYYEEIDAAIEQMINAGNEEISIIAHSFGALVVSLYAKEGKHKALINDMVLNSPFFDWPVSGALYKLTYVLGAMSNIRPFGGLGSDASNDGGAYIKSMHSRDYGEFDFCTDWKPYTSLPKYNAWAKTVNDAKDRIAKGLQLDIPILVLYSDKSYLEGTYSEAYQISDTVLDIEDIKRVSPALGDQVTLAEIKDGMHDIFSSKKEVRAEAYRVIKEWLKK